MADYRLTQTGPTVQQAIDKALEIQGLLDQETAARQAADALLATKTELQSETDRAMAAEALLATISSLQNEVERATGVEGALRALIDAIAAKIPTAASESNQLADKNFVNSSISTATATFRGTSAPGLNQSQFLTWANGLTHDLNDYVYWNTVDSAGNTLYKRYKFDGTNWVFEYDLNNSSFTASEWAAIQSGITAALVAKLSDLPTNIDLQAALNAKYVKPNTGIPASDLEGNIPKSKLDSSVQTSLNKADSAVQDVSNKADKDADAVEGHVAKFDANGNPIDSGVSVEYISQLGQEKIDKTLPSDTFYITDSNGNIIAQIDADGVSSVDVKVKIDGELVSVQSLISSLSGDISTVAGSVVTEKTRAETEEAKKLDHTLADSKFIITDSDGNIIFKVDATGAHSAQDKHAVACMVLGEYYYPTATPTRDGNGNITHAAIMYGTGVEGSVDITYSGGNVTQVIAGYGNYTYTIGIQRDASGNVEEVTVN